MQRQQQTESTLPQQERKNRFMETSTLQSFWFELTHADKSEGTNHLLGFECRAVPEWVTDSELHTSLLRSCIVLGPFFTTGEKVIDSPIVWLLF